MKNSSKHAPPIDHRRKNQERSRLISLLSSIAAGTGAGLVCFCSLLVVFSALCLLMKDPHALALSLSLGAVYISSLVAGFAAVRKNGRRDALLIGALSGLMLLLLLSALAPVFGNSESDGAVKHAIILRLLVIPVAIGGAFLGATKRKPKRKKRF